MREPDTTKDNLLSLVIILPPAFAGFFVAFGCWTLFAVIGVYIRAELALTDLQFGLLLVLPILAGGLIAIPAGIAAQRIGARSVVLVCLVGLIPVLALMSWVDSLWGYALVACGLGLAGGSFSAGLQFLSSRAPPRHRGLALSLYSAGMLGAGFNYYLVALIHDAYSWRIAPLAYLIMLVLVTGLYALLTERDRPSGQDRTAVSLRSNLALLYQPDVMLLCLLFALTGGGIVALALWLPDFISASFELALNRGAIMATGFIVPAALCQVLGGWLADHYGALPVLRRALTVCLIPGALLSYPSMSLVIEGANGPIQLQLAFPLAIEVGLIGLLGMLLGIALGSLLRLLVELQPDRIAFCAGLMLFAGCLSGFLLPLLFTLANQWIGIRSAAFMLMFGFSAVSLLALTLHTRRQIRQQLLKGESALSPWW